MEFVVLAFRPRASAFLKCMWSVHSELWVAEAAADECAKFFRYVVIRPVGELMTVVDDEYVGVEV